MVLLDQCANCGKGEENNKSLKTCTACKAVKYCNRECQMAHRKQHKKECKKRAAALLFEQLPEVTLNLILLYSVPRIEKRVWPWIATLRRTCKTFNRLAKSLAPSSFCLDSYADYFIARWGADPYIDDVQVFYNQ